MAARKIFRFLFVLLCWRCTIIATEVVMANRKWTHEDRQTIVRMWRDGASLIEIADALGVSKDNIGAQVQYMRSLGVDLPYRKATVDVDALNNL